jgi:hypothetical protein
MAKVYKVLKDVFLFPLLLFFWSSIVIIILMNLPRILAL